MPENKHWTALLTRLTAMVILTFLSVGFVAAQEGSEEWPIIKISRKKYYVHTVEAGHTWYAISKKYSVDVEDIKAANPEAGEILSINQVILVPIKKVDKTEARDNPPDLQGEFMVHRVAAKETLYSLSRKYNVAVKDILDNNKDRIEGEAGLKAGSEILIPTKKVAAVANQDHIEPAQKDTLISHRVRVGDTKYSIAQKYNVSEDSLDMVNRDFPLGLQLDMVIRIPRKTRPRIRVKEKPIETYVSPTGIVYGADTANFRKTYNVAVMLPLYLDTNQGLEENRDPEDLEKIFPESMDAVEFYEGALMAVDSMKRMGMNVRLHVYDTKGDTSQLNKLLRTQPELSFMDLFIGPFFRVNVEALAQFTKERKTPIVCPVPVRNRVLLGNDHVSEVVTSELTQLVHLADYVKKNHADKKVLLVRSFKGKDPELFRYFLKRANQLTTKEDSLAGDTMTRVDMSEVSADRILWRLSKEKKNIIIVPSRSPSFVSRFLTRVSSLVKRPDLDITVYGIESWMGLGYESIDLRYFHALNVHVTASHHVNWNDSVTHQFLEHYRSLYFTDPGKSGLGFRGFDVTWFYLNALKDKGVSFQQSLPELKQTGVGTNFDFYKTSLESGYENKSFYLLRYHDFQLERVN